MRKFFTLGLIFNGDMVWIFINSNNMSRVSTSMTRRQFEPLVRSPRAFDYVKRVFIAIHKKSYAIIDSTGKRTQFEDPSDNSLISELVTHKFDIERRIKAFLGMDSPFDPKLIGKVEKPPTPTCHWAHFKARWVLGIDDYVKPPELLGSIHAVPIIDRTETVKFVTDKLVSDRPHPDYSVPETRTFEELMLVRAEEIWRWIEDDGREAVVWWSGGIDSTALLVAMLRTSTTSRMQLIKIGLNDRSIKEYPEFFNDVVKKLSTEFVSHNDGSELDLTRLHISGEIGDQLFGSDMLQACFGYSANNFEGKEFFAGRAHKNWRDTMSPFVLSHLTKLGRDEHHQAIMDLYDTLCAVSPIEINTTFDFWWWMNFNLKYTHVSNRIQLGTLDSATAREVVVAFFDTEYFQKWSVANHDKKIKDTWKSYKYTLKQFVFDWNQDQNWFDNKTKVQSLRFYQDTRNLFMDTTYTRYGRDNAEDLINTYFGGENGS